MLHSIKQIKVYPNLQQPAGRETLIALSITWPCATQVSRCSGGTEQEFKRLEFFFKGCIKS